MLKSILVPVRGDGMVATVLAHAAELAKQHQAQVNVVHCRAQANDLIPPGIALSDFARKVMVEQAVELANRQEDHLRKILHRLAQDFGLEENAIVDGTATCTFAEVHGRMADVVKHAGRLSDLIVLPKPQRERNLGQSSLKAALYGAGRPVLICPGQLQPDETFAQHVAVGWNGSLPAARAVASSLDIVHAAKRVSILTGGKVQSHGPTVEELVDYYALRGIIAEVVRFKGKDAATELLETSKSVGASLLVIGAYSHSHETEMLFGGNTERIVDKTEMPILMAH
ncbi:universal stress protein [Marivita lacus]|uniref:Universal stress protein n=1 Tax=Marivita lacus TaxID=1323742 RepID=A0ABQ1KVF0_9RHOB|nr:universal stress protein [Marivita lacus]MDP4990505.1 universal stress protein [Marivita lacus]GGC08896.1 universal stress protein [Marivita lacus]